MDKLYELREQAFIKHKLLEDYFEKLLLIIGMKGAGRGVEEICYIDGFAGHWGDESEELKSTSIRISLDIIERCKARLDSQGRSVRFRALYIEKDPKAFSKLKSYLNRRKIDGVETTAINGAFEKVIPDVLKWCGQKPFCFFFIDPMGWKEIAASVLKDLLARPKSEFLINFMFNFINRTISISIPAFREQIKDLLGEGDRVNQIASLSKEERERATINAYRDNLKRCMKRDRKYPPRTARVRMYDRTKERVKYHLVYVTTHPKGINEFMTAAEASDITQGKVRARLKREQRTKNTGQAEMVFDTGDTDTLYGQGDDGNIKQYLLDRIGEEGCRFDIADKADILEQTDCFPSEIQNVVKKMIDSGEFDNPDIKGTRRTKFLDFEKKEMLRRVQ